MSVESEAE